MNLNHFKNKLVKSRNFHGDLSQDKWVDSVFDSKRSGYFLDFGAFDGIDMSNTIYLERERGWTGICVEANPTYYPKLCAARSAICINNALWPVSRQQVQLVDAHGLSSVEHLVNGDSNAEIRKKATERVVSIDTVNPTDLLDRFRAPRDIEYLSLDVEGLEYDIIQSIDLEKYNVMLMTVEHDANQERRDRLREYLRQFSYIGLQMGYDDFFFKSKLNYPNCPRKSAIKFGCTDVNAYA